MYIFIHTCGRDVESVQIQSRLNPFSLPNFSSETMATWTFFNLKSSLFDNHDHMALLWLNCLGEQTNRTQQDRQIPVLIHSRYFYLAMNSIIWLLNMLYINMRKILKWYDDWCLGSLKAWPSLGPNLKLQLFRNYQVMLNFCSYHWLNKLPWNFPSYGILVEW